MDVQYSCQSQSQSHSSFYQFLSTRAWGGLQYKYSVQLTVLEYFFLQAPRASFTLTRAPLTHHNHNQLRPV